MGGYAIHRSTSQARRPSRPSINRRPSDKSKSIRPRPVKRNGSERSAATPQEPIDRSLIDDEYPKTPEEANLDEDQLIARSRPNPQVALLKSPAPIDDAPRRPSINALNRPIRQIVGAPKTSTDAQSPAEKALEEAVKTVGCQPSERSRTDGQAENLEEEVLREIGDDRPVKDSDATKRVESEVGRRTVKKPPSQAASPPEVTVPIARPPSRLSQPRARAGSPLGAGPFAKAALAARQKMRDRSRSPIASPGVTDVVEVHTHGQDMRERAARPQRTSLASIRDFVPAPAPSNGSTLLTPARPSPGIAEDTASARRLRTLESGLRSQQATLTKATRTRMLQRQESISSTGSRDSFAQQVDSVMLTRATCGNVELASGRSSPLAMKALPEIGQLDITSLRDRRKVLQMPFESVTSVSVSIISIDGLQPADALTHFSTFSPSVASRPRLQFKLRIPADDVESCSGRGQSPLPRAR